MSYRFMRVMILFDLPVLTNEDLKTYRQFRRFLLKSGFIMMQESVYTKLALNNTVANSVMESIRKNKPNKGLVQMMLVTENNSHEWSLLQALGRLSILIMTKGLLTYDFGTSAIY